MRNLSRHTKSLIIVLVGYAVPFVTLVTALIVKVIEIY